MALIERNKNFVNKVRMKLEPQMSIVKVVLVKEKKRENKIYNVIKSK